MTSTETENAALTRRADNLKQAFDILFEIVRSFPSSLSDFVSPEEERIIHEARYGEGTYNPADYGH